MSCIDHIIIGIGIYIIISCAIFCIGLEFIPNYTRDDVDLVISFLWPVILLIIIITIIYGFISEIINAISHRNNS